MDHSVATKQEIKQTSKELNEQGARSRQKSIGRGMKLDPTKYLGFLWVDRLARRLNRQIDGQAEQAELAGKRCRTEGGDGGFVSHYFTMHQNFPIFSCDNQILYS